MVDESGARITDRGTFPECFPEIIFIAASGTLEVGDRRFHNTSLSSIFYDQLIPRTLITARLILIETEREGREVLD